MTGGLGFMLASPAMAQSDDQSVPTVMSLRLAGVVDPFEANYISGAISDAEDQHLAAVLLTMDTPGGLDSSMRKITQAILNSRVPVICYTSPSGARAASAGTFIMLSCPVAAMAPGTNIGAAHPVGVSGIIEQEKVTNDAVATIRSYAQHWGRNANWAERAVRDAISASADEALRLNVIDLIEPNVPSLLDVVDGEIISSTDGAVTYTLHTADANVETRGLGIGGAILHGLLSPDLSFIFFYLGLGLLVAGLLHHPVALVGGILSLGASFVSFGVLPVQLIGILLLVASAVFFLLELKHPGLGLPSIGGMITLILGGLFLFDPRVPNAHVSPWVIAPVAIFTGLFFIFAVGAAVRARRLPKRTGREPLLGLDGLVTSILEPKGVVQVAGERWTAESDGATVPAGTRVRVVGMDGLTLRVEPVMERVEGGVS
ncbi:MAG: nodulation protein NfeD [Actinobacteria bacterium]|nr:nodulation protein NfeD [Actinomycetota bacterium]